MFAAESRVADEISRLLNLEPAGIMECIVFDASDAMNYIRISDGLSCEYSQCDSNAKIELRVACKTLFYSRADSQIP